MGKKQIKTVVNGSAYTPFLLGTLSAGAVLFLFFAAPAIAPITYEAAVIAIEEELQEEEVIEEVFKPIYLDTPESVKAIYMTQCLVGTPSLILK